MNKHTPGPWVKNGINWYGSNGEKVVISNGPAYGSKIHFPSAEANTRLIAAAPELLEALETLAEHFEYYMGDNECRPLENARAAIAKATGSQ